MQYQFKLGPEIFWAIVIAAVLAVAQILVTLRPEEIADWRFWAITTAGAVARAAGGAIVGYMTARRQA